MKANNRELGKALQQSNAKLTSVNKRIEKSDKATKGLVKQCDQILK